MSEFVCRVAEAADAPAIAALANQYTYQQLSAEARESGFLTGTFAVPALQAMLVSVPGQVVYRQQELVGFVINSRLAAERYPPLVQQIAALLPELQYQQRPLADYRWFFYGPVLVKNEHRGQGVLRQLFEASQRALAGHYEVGVAFIAAENAASLHVHTHKLGLVPVGSLEFGGASYVVLAFGVANGAAPARG
jgi:predicted N-acetyltransferase YhbS